MKGVSKYGNSGEKDPHIFRHRGFDYKISLDDFLNLNDYYLDFTLLSVNYNAVQMCDSISLRDYINSNYKNTESLKRLSAKIIASNDPVLNIQGIPSL
jgi:hypothetical protein